VEAAPDPDGDRPAETSLVGPLDHFRNGEFAAGVNANAWGMVPRPPAGESPRYVEGGACDVNGWVVADATQRSPADGGYWSFWVGGDGETGIGNAGFPPRVQVAVAGFGGLLKESRILPGPSDTHHPRTALGLDPGRRTLVLVVVDGRQPGYSEGVSERELAELMLDLGCADALNLDGGGSSIMILRGDHGSPRIANRPSDRSGPRPIPVLFGVRPRRRCDGP
jgi:hypothetical protein